MTIADDPGVRTLIELARSEDFGAGDVTTALMEGADRPARFHLIAKAPCVLAGAAVLPAILQAYDASLAVEWCSSQDLDPPPPEACSDKEEGDDPPDRPFPDGWSVREVPFQVATIRGQLASILAAERVLLNFLQRLCGVATLTRRFVEAVRGTGAAVYDTRKTTPGWRKLEKYAVRCGGGCNHRMGLYDAILIKDNHLAGTPPQRIAAVVFDMLNRLDERGRRPALIEVEADSLAQAEMLFTVVGIDVVLLDNFSLDDLRRAVRLRDELGLKGKVALEASGGITLETVRAVAETGVERISIGALTHAAPAVDLSLERA
ncbi:MAG: carboxylating nicotinate-nucleotide diphosphorylase [Planctomycetota bacterium]|nr:MAG: carboxylating nicotinate-nucleotide diphosphorylase [Planctomycetota bacterium]